MSETLTPTQEIVSAEPVDRFAGIEFGSDTPQAAEHAAETGQEAPAETKPTEKPAGQGSDEPGWYVKRIGALTAKRKEAEERAAEVERERDELRRALAATRGDEPQEQELTPDQIRQQERDNFARQQAQQAEERNFVAATERVAQSLVASYGADAIQSATRALVEKAGLDFNNISHQQIIRDISELPNSGAVYYALSNDPDAASDLLAAPERKQFALLQRFADKVPTEKAENQVAKPAPAISKAPPPVAATSGSGRVASGRSIYDTDLSMDDYIRLRSKK